MLLEQHDHCTQYVPRVKNGCYSCLYSILKTCRIHVNKKNIPKLPRLLYRTYQKKKNNICPDKKFWCILIEIQGGAGFL